MIFSGALCERNFVASETFLKIPLVGILSLDSFRAPPPKVGLHKAETR
jgi:hypothetical protein